MVQKFLQALAKNENYVVRRDLFLNLSDMAPCTGIEVIPEIGVCSFAFSDKFSKSSLSAFDSATFTNAELSSPSNLLISPVGTSYMNISLGAESGMSFVVELKAERNYRYLILISLYEATYKICFRRYEKTIYFGTVSMPKYKIIRFIRFRIIGILLINM